MLDKPIKRATAHAGFDIVLWKHNAYDIYTIMCYPLAVNSCKGTFAPKRGERFCLPLNVGEKGEEIFSKLINGDVMIYDLWKYFHEPSIHAYALGMIQNEVWNADEYWRYAMERRCTK